MFQTSRGSLLQSQEKLKNIKIFSREHVAELTNIQLFYLEHKDLDVRDPIALRPGFNLTPDMGFNDMITSLKTKSML